MDIFGEDATTSKKERVMHLNKEQEDLYRITIDEVKKQIEDIDGKIEKELQKVRERLAELQESKKSLKMIYGGMANILGVEVEQEDDILTSSPMSTAKM
jgi:ElaB/YqjD/DUF883 family membrane-anchored ribosome-binding protein